MAYTPPHEALIVPQLGIYNKKEWPLNHKIYAAMITRMDTELGKLLNLLEELGIDENTLILFTSDNGMQSPGSAANPIAGLLTMAVGTAIRQMAEGPGIRRYFYLTGNVESGFRITDEHLTIRSKVDAYEIAQQENRVKFRHKGYFIYDESLISIYQDGRSNKLSLVKFPF